MKKEFKSLSLKKMLISNFDHQQITGGRMSGRLCALSNDVSCFSPCGGTNATSYCTP